MREIRPSGSEGGVGLIPHPYPYHIAPTVPHPKSETRARILPRNETSGFCRASVHAMFRQSFSINR